eukprot:CAMPEP_0202851084 /NCGR_PEP_ID=MMETSP1389-20130828/85342_1 /ASSEMBLY_ACC=CAM_ASM_000865 /TAXON_ID=302021 /ORGANISM="Rhodomonas sp., Strain CCMP768" /LENGTH=77 /DNA_ID=CAMNT_0049529347 /DNA_START=83 /DNA_END=313 /DNA_ORIENTATION=-
MTAPVTLRLGVRDVRTAGVTSGSLRPKFKVEPQAQAGQGHLGCRWAGFSGTVTIAGIRRRAGPRVPVSCDSGVAAPG